MPTTFDDIEKNERKAQEEETAIYGGSFWATLEANAAIAREAQKRYEYDKGLRQPYIDSSRNYLTMLNQMMTDPSSFDLNTVPGYRARVSQGQKAIERSAAAKHGLYSGETGKSLNAWAQDYASAEWEKEAKRRAELAYAPSPWGWSPGTAGGASDYPTLRSFQDSYKDMFEKKETAPSTGGGAKECDGEHQREYYDDEGKRSCITDEKAKCEDGGGTFSGDNWWESGKCSEPKPDCDLRHNYINHQGECVPKGDVGGGGGSGEGSGEGSGW